MTKDKFYEAEDILAQIETREKELEDIEKNGVVICRYNKSDYRSIPVGDLLWMEITNKIKSEIEGDIKKLNEQFDAL